MSRWSSWVVTCQRAIRTLGAMLTLHVLRVGLLLACEMLSWFAVYHAMCRWNFMGMQRHPALRCASARHACHPHCLDLRTTYLSYQNLARTPPVFDSCYSVLYYVCCHRNADVVCACWHCFACFASAVLSSELALRVQLLCSGV